MGHAHKYHSESDSIDEQERCNHRKATSAAKITFCISMSFICGSARRDSVHCGGHPVA